MSAPQEQEITKLAEAEINLTAQQLADIIWLMSQIKQSNGASEVSSSSTIKNLQKILPPSQNIESIASYETVKQHENTAPIYVDKTSEPEFGLAGLPIKIGDPLALRDALGLGRSLRSLMRKVPSLTEKLLNEEATVNSIAEEDFWLPVFQPVPTQWLEVALVIEETARYPVWRQTLTEFQQLLERHGAFRNVILWYLKTGSKGEAQLYAKNRQVSLEELNAPSGRRLIWVVSDCVSSIWHDGSLLKVLRNWAKIQPVSLLQLLPERLWPRTALGWGIEVQLYSEIPGAPNSRLLKTRKLVETQFNSPQALTLPIVTLEPLPLKNWAKVLAGVGGSRTPGLVFLPEEIKPYASSNDTEDNQLSAKARVSRFRAAASPLSRQLGRMMAAAPVSLPVIRLIQQTLLPGSSVIHLAEVLMGGLLKPTTTKLRDGVKEEINYEFYEGVREELIKITPKSKTFDVILCLSEFVNRELQLKHSVRNFEAMLFNSDVEIDPDYLPFAQITAQTLELLGGKYADYVQQIQQKILASEPDIFLSPEESLEYAEIKEFLSKIKEFLSDFKFKNLSDWTLFINTTGELMKELHLIAIQLSQYDIWNHRESLEIQDPDTGIPSLRPDLRSNTLNELDLEEQELSNFLYQQLDLALTSAIEQEVKERLSTLQKSKNYGPLAKQFIPGLQLYYCQGMSLKEIAPKLEMTRWDQARRVLNPGELLSKVRNLTVQKLLDSLLKEAENKGLSKIPHDHDYIQTLATHIEVFTDGEIFTQALEELRTGKNRSMSSFYSQKLRIYLEQHR